MLLGRLVKVEDEEVIRPWGKGRLPTTIELVVAIPSCSSSDKEY